MYRDPSFIRAYKATHCVEAWTEHVVSKKKSVADCTPLLPLLTRSLPARRQKRWRKKHNKFEYPYAEARM